jgi:hypothetical protein
MDDRTLNAFVFRVFEVDTITAKEGKVGIPKSTMFPKKKSAIQFVYTMTPTLY